MGVHGGSVTLAEAKAQAAKTQTQTNTCPAGMSMVLRDYLSDDGADMVASGFVKQHLAHVQTLMSLRR